MDKQDILELIDEKVYTNGNKEITGAGLNEVLKALVNNVCGKGLIYAFNWPHTDDERSVSFNTIDALSEYTGFDTDTINALIDGTLVADLVIRNQATGLKVGYATYNSILTYGSNYTQIAWILYDSYYSGMVKTTLTYDYGQLSNNIYRITYESISSSDVIA